MLKYNHNLKPQARRFRAEMTDSEQMLWSRLRRKQIRCVQFYRQKPIGNYIVDFHAPKAKLVVEVDGSQHLDARHVERDTQRDTYLVGQGLRVLRFSKLQELDAVVEAIFQELTDRLDGNPPNPPLQRGAKGGFFPPELAS